jgi:hypothetical protein
VIEDLPTTPSPLVTALRIGALLALTLLLFWFFIVRPAQKEMSGPNVDHVFTSEQFEFPVGCPAQSYARTDKIPQACAARKYHIDDYKKLGMRTELKSYKWYRVGNDALYLGCVNWRDECVRVYKVENFYVVRPRRKQ